MPEALQAYRIRWALLVGLVLSVTYAYCTAERGAHLTFTRDKHQHPQQHLAHHHHRPHPRPQYLLPPLLAASRVSQPKPQAGRPSDLTRPLSTCKGVGPAAMASAPASGLKESYSLWAMPKGRLGEQLKAEIAALAQRHGAPAFPPHVTVLGDIERPREEVVAKMRELAAQAKKYRINFVDVTRGSIFYQCVYLLVAKDEGTMAAAEAARRVFGKATPPYMPHLSLLYSDIDEAEREQVVKYERDRLYGESSGYDTLLVENGYEVGSLALWYTPTEDRSLQSWCMVEEFELS